MEKLTKPLYIVWQDAFQQGEPIIDDNEPQILLLFLKDWWQNHLKLHKKITPFLQKWEGN